MNQSINTDSKNSKEPQQNHTTMRQIRVKPALLAKKLKGQVA